MRRSFFINFIIVISWMTFVAEGWLPEHPINNESETFNEAVKKIILSGCNQKILSLKKLFPYKLL